VQTHEVAGNRCMSPAAALPPAVRACWTSALHACVPLLTLGLSLHLSRLLMEGSKLHRLQVPTLSPPCASYKRRLEVKSKGRNGCCWGRTASYIGLAQHAQHGVTLPSGDHEVTRVSMHKALTSRQMLMQGSASRREHRGALSLTQSMQVSRLYERLVPQAVAAPLTGLIRKHSRALLPSAHTTSISIIYLPVVCLSALTTSYPWLPLNAGH